MLGCDIDLGLSLGKAKRSRDDELICRAFRTRHLIS